MCSIFLLKSNEFVWWKLDKSFFNFEEDIYVCLAYIAPANSRHYGKSEKDPYDELKTQLLNYSKLRKIILMGDFNTRKRNLSDSSVDSNNDFHLTDISEIADINVECSGIC